MSISQEEVVLVDEKNNVLGTMPKALVHGPKTPLHRGFSTFVFNKKGELLIQQRARSKKTWPLVWSNSFCGHPALEETNKEAARRCALFELGLELQAIKEVLPYRYKVTKDGIMENEICPILLGVASGEAGINLEEVENVRWLKWRDFLKEIADKPDKFSLWCLEEAVLLEENFSLSKKALPDFIFEICK